LEPDKKNNAFNIFLKTGPMSVFGDILMILNFSKIWYMANFSMVCDEKWLVVFQYSNEKQKILHCRNCSKIY
jgi:hypothetical protein